MSKPLDAEVLRRKYIDEYKPIKTVAEELGVSVGHVYNSLKRYGIQTRDRLDYPFTQKQIEHARKIGLAKKGTVMSAEQRKKLSAAKKGKIRKPSKYGGYTKVRTDGYISVFVPDHPNCNAEGLVMEHRLVMEYHIGRYLTKDEAVHHINHDRRDNRLENLQLMTHGEHTALHNRERSKKRGGMTY
jgi:hypothetical protein